MDDSSTDEMRDRRELSSGAIAGRLAELNEGDRILFNDRQKPLVVTDTDATSNGLGGEINGVRVRGPHSGQYVLSHEGDWYRGNIYRRSLRWVEIVDK